LSTLTLGDRRIHLDQRWVVWPGGEAKLTETEAALLRYLVARDEPSSREDLLSAVWGAASGIRIRTVDTSVRRLRKKIEADPVQPIFLLTVYGVGYRLVLPETVPTPAPQPFAALGPFDLLDLVGRGASSEVWSATHRRSNTRVAVKIMNGRHLADASASTAVLREARAAASLDHPNIVRLLDLGEVGTRASRATGYKAGTPWLAMELAGGALSSFKGQLRWSELREVLLRALDALAHAHARGVVHLDVKPGNLLVGCGVGEGASRTAGLRLTDFGVARAVDERSSGSIAGTPHYMAPEQIRRAWRDIGPWTDIFGLGATAWALVTGRPPFDAGSTRAVLTRGWRPLPELRAMMATPEGLEDWLRRLMARQPYDRFTRAAEAAEALKALRRTREWSLMAVAGRPTPCPPRPCAPSPAGGTPSRRPPRYSSPTRASPCCH